MLRHSKALMPQRLMARRGFMLGLCLAVCSWAQAIEPGTAATIPPPALQEALGKLLGELRSRQLAPAGDEELGRLACQALLDAFATGGTVVDRQPGIVAPAPPPPGPILSHVGSISGRFGYLRIAAVEPGLAQAIAAARTNLPDSAEGGSILDLRDCGGNDPAAATESVAAVGSWGLPTVVIVNSQTRAAAEVLAAGLRREHGAVILGEPTRGVPYPLRPVQLAGGMAVMLPEVPSGIAPAPLRPDVPVAAATDDPARVHPAEAAAGEEERDECVRQAVDLLTAICTFRQKHF